MMIFVVVVVVVVVDVSSLMFLLRNFGLFLFFQLGTIVILKLVCFLFQCVSLSRELLLGTNTTMKREFSLPAHGLFTDRSKTNLFQVCRSIKMTDYYSK